MIDSKSKHIADEGLSITISRTPTDYTGKAIIGKIGKTLSDYSVQNKRMINCLLESNLATGELVTCEGEQFITVVSRKEIIQGQEVAIIAYGLICNATLTVTRTETAYDDDGNPSGETPTTVVNAVPCRADQVTYRMRQEDPGLLAQTVLKIYAKNVAGLALLDKATVAGSDYRVDDINRLEIAGAMVLQLSVWTG